ncbi:hypothetical protein [Reichenbachiella ulvae]|uniref:LTXXQ motif family protein n=1 Tax=Reichenbachiella ulvae TaxID=2980104 RepID=A0ABT3CN51_9BACT|nr:hypothetical protein [Reichenbachiella ulvae]MCV9385166.1 hypothetical protein [Reichenbachiella ulvae]
MTFRSTLICVLFLGATLPTFSQSVAEIDRDEYFAELNLTEEQKPEFDTILDEYYSTLEEIPHNETSKTDMLKAYIKSTKVRDKKMKSILSKEQFKLFHHLEMELERRARKEYRG